MKPIKTIKKRERKKIKKGNFQPEWFFLMKSEGLTIKPFYPLLVNVCVNIHWKSVGGGLPFQDCPAVDVFGICGSCF